MVCRVFKANRVDMRHHVQYRVGGHYSLACLLGNGVGIEDIHVAIHFQMDIHQDQIAHFAGAQVMQRAYAAGGQQGVANGIGFFGVGSAVHQVVQ
jgi:hypothetical protein